MQTMRRIRWKPDNTKQYIGLMHRFNLDIKIKKNLFCKH